MKTSNQAFNRGVYRLTASSNRMTNLNEAKKESNADVSYFNSAKKADKKSETSYTKQPGLWSEKCDRTRISSKDRFKEKEDNREKQRIGSRYEKTPREKLLYYQPRHKSVWMNNSAPQNPLTTEANEQTSHDISVSDFSLTQSMQKTKKLHEPHLMVINYSGHSGVSGSRRMTNREKVLKQLRSESAHDPIINGVCQQKRVEQSKIPSSELYSEWNNQSEKLQQAARNSAAGGSSELTEELTNYVLKNKQNKSMPHNNLPVHLKLFKNTTTQNRLKQSYEDSLNRRKQASEDSLKQAPEESLNARILRQTSMKQNDPNQMLADLQKAIELINDLDLD